MFRVKVRPSNKINKNKEAPLLFDITYGKKRYYVSSSITIPPNLWNHKKQEIRKNGDINSSVLNLDLKLKKDDIVKSCETIFSKGLEFNKDNILRFTEIVGNSINESEFTKCFNLFLEERKGELAPSTYEKYEYLKIVLEEFENNYNYKLSFSSINDKFYRKFQDYFFKERNVYNNGFGGYIKNLKSFLNWSTKKGYNNNLAYKDFKVLKEEKDIFPLSEKEIEVFEKAKLSGRFDEIRDIFLFQVYTGLRISDTQRLRPQHINGHSIINFHDLKTKNKLIIPLIPKANKILKKYNRLHDDGFVLPKTSTQDANRILKDIAIYLKLFNEVIYYRTKGVEIEEFKSRRCDIITTHDARRTFITYCLSKGMSAQMIMKITGHKDYKAFEKYIKFSETEITNQLNFIWK